MKRPMVLLVALGFMSLFLNSCSENAGSPKSDKQNEPARQSENKPSPTQGASMNVDANLHSYKTISGISGNLSSVGSDTMNNLMALWAEDFYKFYPSVKIQVEGKGSSTAPPALISGTAQLGPMSRAMKSSELDAFEKKFGYKPTQINTAVDALAVFVNKDNPLECLPLDQVDAIFSKSRRRGYANDIKTWLYLVSPATEWTNRPISIFGRNSASGTYGFFKEHVLKNGDYKDAIKEQPGSASVVQGIANDRYAIGYSGIGYTTADVKAIALAEKSEDECVTPTPDNAYSGRYPLARFLYVYVNKAPNQNLDPLTREFVRFIFSKEGQMAVIKDGYYPLPASMAEEELNKIKYQSF